MRLRNLFLASAVALSGVTFAHAQSFSLTNTANNFFTTFDTGDPVISLANSGTANPLPANILVSTGTTYAADNGSSNTGRFYSYGATGTNERAFGSAASGSFSGYYGFRFVNDGTSAINSITVNYDGEFWRRGGNTSGATQSLQFSYAIDATDITTGTYTAFSDLDYSVNDTGAATPSGGVTTPYNVTAKSSTITFATPVAAGSNVLIRWQDINDAGNDHGLAIDNLNVNATFQPVPAPPAAVSLGIGSLIGLMGTGVRTLRARKQAKRKESAK